MATQLLPQMAELRRDIHAHPELGRSEYRTAQTLEQFFAKLNIPTRRVADTGIEAVLDFGRPGPTVALRADIDALPITEATGADFASQTPGVMHACGHDVHTAAVAGAALLLLQDAQNLSGRIKFLFQPDEEGDGGAQRLVEAGTLDDVDVIFGAHVNPDLRSGTVGIRYGKFYAASNPFDITFIGKASHGAEPENGIDALSAAAEAEVAFQSLRREMEARHGRVIISVGSLHAGTARNIIADRAEMHGIIRTLGPEARQETVAKLEETIRTVAEKYGAELDVNIAWGYPGIVNHDEPTRLAEKAAKALLGEDKVIPITQPTMTTEDFGFYLDKVPGCFYHIGVGGSEAIHSCRFLPQDSAIATAAAMHGAVIKEVLRKQ